ncbi:MAG: hypothetical protein IRY85_10040 [Micromonosporaceae bacterium]|nr:hypothetical protein [Micromonosporaceae bacterium]
MSRGGRSGWQLVGGKWRRTKTKLDGQILGVVKSPPCHICGRPVPSGAVRCEQPCQPRINKQAKTGDET